MPQVKQQLPVPLRPFEFHGVPLSYREGDDEARGDCPFCGRESKLYANAETGQWNCRVCSEGGNAYTLFRRLWEKRGSSHRIDDLAREKRLTGPGLEAWGVGLNPFSGDVVCPGFDAGGKQNQLYRWTWNAVEKRWYWMLAKGTNHWMLGVQLFDPSKPDVYVCEGLWDGIALWEFMRTHFRTENGIFVPTDDVRESMLSTANVVAIPTATTFNEQWCPLFSGRRVFFLCDNDHPDRQGRMSGLEGTKHAVNVLVWAEEPPLEMQWLVWDADQGYDPDLPHRYDVRDLLTLPPENGEGVSEEELHLRAGRLFTSLQPVPAEWVEGAKKKGRPVVEPLECRRWEDLVPACEKGLLFHEGMDRALSVMLAMAASVDIGLDQLWGKFIGPPSSGKTTLADGLLVARKYATSISIITGLHSGYKDPESDGDKDFSVMAKVKGKAAVMKDGDTLIQTENKAKTMSDLRDAYDRKTSVTFKNGIDRLYEDHSFVLLVFGTESLRDIDASELGQRFIDCVVMDGVDEKVENDLLDYKARSNRLILKNQATANGDRVEGKDKLTCKRMIGGYLIYLRQNIKYLIEEVDMSEAAEEHLKAYAKVVAIFRARPSTTQSESQTREIAGRLFDQLMKLAYCLAVVMNRKTVDEEVMRRVRRTALDTARGKTMNLARAVFKAGHAGKDVTSLSVQANTSPQETKKLLIFLKEIGIMEPFAPKGKVGLGAKSNRWRLRPDVLKLYKKIMK